MQVGNDGAAAGTGKGDGSLYLGQHGTGSELVLADVLLRLGNAHLLQALLIGLAPVDGNTVHSGEDEQRIRVQQLRDLGGSKVLIDNRGNAYQLAVLLDDRDSAAADGDDNRAGFYNSLYYVLLHHVNGLGGGNDTAVAAAGILDHGKALGRGDLFRLLLGIESADGLGGLLESAVVLIYEDLGNDGRYGLVDAALRQLVADGVLQMIADVTLGHRAALGERHIALDGAGFGRSAHRQVDHTNLRTVAVGNDHFVAGLDEVNDGLCGLGHQIELLIGGVAKRVAAEGNYNSGHSRFLLLYVFSMVFRL